MAGFFDFMSIIMKSLQDPSAAAKTMAELNISPEEIQQQTQHQNQLQIMQQQTQQPDESALNWRQRIQQPSVGEVMQSQQGPVRGMPNRFYPTPGGAALTEGVTPNNQFMPWGLGNWKPAAGAVDPARFANAAPATVPPGMPPQGVTAPNMASLPPTLGGIMAPAPTGLPGATPEQNYFGQQPINKAMNSGEALPSNMNPAQQASVGTTSVPTMRSAQQFKNVDPELRAIISGAATKYGQDPNTLMRIAGIESSFNPKAKNPKSSAGGLFQFINSTAGEYGLKDKFDPAQASDAAARLMRDNRAYLLDKLGREPTPGELYLAHQQGKAGAERLLIDPDVRAADIVGSKAITLNGGTPDMTAGQFASLWTSKFDKFGGTEGGGTSVAKGGASSTPTAAGSDVGTEVAQTATPTAATTTPTEPKSKAQTLADKLAEIGKSIEVPEGGGGNELPMGSPSPPRPGNFNVNPETMRTMLAMLGPMMGGPAQIPTLAQLMQGRG